MKPALNVWPYFSEKGNGKVYYLCWEQCYLKLCFTRFVSYNYSGSTNNTCFLVKCKKLGYFLRSVKCQIKIT